MGERPSWRAITRASVSVFFGLFRAGIWTCLAVFFGLIQLWIVIALCRLDRDLTFDLNRVVLECGVVFFCTALVAGLALDFFSSNRKVTMPLWFVGFTYALFPLLVVGLAAVVYSVCYGGNPDINFVKNVEVVVLIMSLVYAIGVKYIAFAARHESS